MGKLTIGEEFVKKYIMIIRESTGAERHLFILPKVGMQMSEISKHTTATAPKSGYLEIEIFSNRYTAMYVKKRFVDMIRSYDDPRRIYFNLTIWFTAETVKTWFPSIAAEVKKVLDRKRQATLENNMNRAKNEDKREIASIMRNKSAESFEKDRRNLELETSTEEPVNATR